MVSKRKWTKLLLLGVFTLCLPTIGCDGAGGCEGMGGQSARGVKQGIQNAKDYGKGFKKEWSKP